jgi:hypothetical protein
VQVLTKTYHLNPAPEDGEMIYEGPLLDRAEGCAPLSLSLSISLFLFLILFLSLFLFLFRFRFLFLTHIHTLAFICCFVCQISCLLFELNSSYLLSFSTKIEWNEGKDTTMKTIKKKQKKKGMFPCSPIFLFDYIIVSNFLSLVLSDLVCLSLK